MLSNILIQLNYFNSIKVRLERTFPILKELANGFQFHKGAIRTVDNYLSLNYRPISIP